MGLSGRAGNAGSVDFALGGYAQFKRCFVITVVVHCPTCQVFVVMQPGQKRCANCKTLIGVSLWVVEPSPLTKEEIEAGRVKAT